MKFLYAILATVLLLLVPAQAKQYPMSLPDYKLVDTIIEWEAAQLGVPAPGRPAIVVTDFCQLQNYMTKSKNACLMQAVGALFFFTTYYRAVYTPGTPGLVRLSDHYDWSHPSREAVLILAHELAHHVLLQNGIAHKDGDAHKLAKKFVDAYFKR